MVKIIFWQSIKLKHPYLTENQVIYQNSTTLDPEEPKILSKYFMLGI